MATVQELKKMIQTRVSIVAVIRRFVKLQRRGNEQIGLCPFHHERTPSFSVNESKGIFKCFGCGASGDMIEFIMKHEKLAFVEAMEKIASLESMPYNRDDETRKGKFHMKQSSRNFKAVDKIYLEKTLDKYSENIFFRFIESLVGFDEAINLMLQFYVGTVNNGGTIFWQVDQFQTIRTAQVIFYQPNGKRNKAIHPGKPQDRQGRSLFTINQGYEPCFFGEHQLFKAEANDLIAIVESEKTAILCSIFLPELDGRRVIWIASGGNNGITENKAWCLSGLNVCLVPDFSWLSRATWGLVPMRRDQAGKCHPEGEIDEKYFSRAALLQGYGCNVSFFDPFPELNDNSDIADELLKLHPPAMLPKKAETGLLAPDFNTLKL